MAVGHQSRTSASCRLSSMEAYCGVSGGPAMQAAECSVLNARMLVHATFFITASEC